MRTPIVIDDQFMADAMQAGGFETRRNAVEEGLRLIVRHAAYQNLRSLRGKLQWSLDGDWTEETCQASSASAMYRVAAP